MIGMEQLFDNAWPGGMKFGFTILNYACKFSDKKDPGHME
jgi:hypothetical protein